MPGVEEPDEGGERSMDSAELRRANALKRVIGRHGYADRAGQLTLPELGSLVITAGCEAGFVVQVEVPVAGGKRDAKLDCAWFATDGTMVVAFEFDGRDVGREHISGSEEKGKLGNAEKFRRSGALVRVQALYTLRNERVLPPRKGTTDAMKPEVEVLSDEELHAGVIDDVVARAVGAARERGLTMLGEG